MIAFNKYAQIKDKCCIGYFGYCDDYLKQLRVIRPILEKAFPGLQIYLSCRDGKHDLLGTDRTLTYQQFREAKEDFACLIELKTNGRNNPVNDLLLEAGLAVHVQTEQ
jgi:hypothetical protein